MNDLGQFYTEQIFSNLLVNKIKQEKPNTILDLGVGAGSLTKAASLRWIGAIFYGVDIDAKSINRLKSELPFVNLSNLNGLSLALPSELNIRKGTIDVAICNPPYLRITQRETYYEILKNAGLEECVKLKSITSDILFLAQNLQLLRTGGELGIILPDSLITGHEFALFRKALMKNHALKCIIQLPDKVYPKTEARTHILLIEKSGKSKSKIPLYNANKLGICADEIMISHEQLQHRMDFTYHNFVTRNILPFDSSLEKIGAEIKRGNVSHKELKELKRPYFHTTTFKENPTLDSEILDKSKIFAKPGDILLARVGKRCIGKVFMVKKGQFLISDCIYRIRTHKRYQKSVFQTLCSTYGQEWLKFHAHGVCSQVLSKKDLIKFPFNIN